MKSKFFTLFAVFMLLFGAKVMAQTNGDVNEDGVVNEQDIEAIIKIMQDAGGVKEQTKYYWYWNNDPEILFGDPLGEQVDYSKAQQVISFEELGFTTDGTQVTLKNTGTNNVYILCPKAWVNKFAIFNSTNAANVTKGYGDISEFITNLTMNGVEYVLLEAQGMVGNKAYIRSI